MQKSVFEQVRHRSVLTLEKMCLTRVMTELCNNPQLLDSLKNFIMPKRLLFRLTERNSTSFLKIYINANRMISQMRISAVLEKKLLDLLWPISYRIMGWKSVYAFDIENEFLERFYWTNQGRIDTIRTVRNIISNKNVSIRTRFLMACSVCLEKEIQEIWTELSDDDKTYFATENFKMYHAIVLFWVHTLKGTNNILKNYFNDAYECAAKNTLLEAVKYFFSVSRKHKNENIGDIFLPYFEDKSDLTIIFEEMGLDILFFYFCKIPAEFLVVLFNTIYPELLSLLLYSSKSNHFLQLLKDNHHSMDYIEASWVLQMVFCLYHLEVNIDGDYRKLFIKVWRLFPTSMRNSLKGSYEGVTFTCALIKDYFPFLLKKGAFKRIRELTSPASKHHTFLTPFGFHQDKWEFLNFLIKEEIVTIACLKLNRDDAFYFLDVKKSNLFAFNNVLYLVRKIGMKAPLTRKLNHP